MKAGLPNILSAARLPLAVAFPLVEGPVERMAIIAVAALTDWVDGPLARRLGQATPVGAVLDPVADKVFIVTVLATLAVERDVPIWAIVLILLRDIGVLLGMAGLALAGRLRRLQARKAGKVVTWLQFGALAVLLAWPVVAPWIAPPIALAGVLALRDYARSAKRA